MFNISIHLIYDIKILIPRIFIFFLADETKIVTQSPKLRQMAKREPGKD